KLAKAKLGPEHPHTLAAMETRAVAYEHAGKLDQADRLWREVLQCRRKQCGPKSVATASDLAEVGQILLKQQKYVEAEPPQRECLTIREEKSPYDCLRFNTTSLLGGALLGQKKYADAEPLLVQGYEGMKQREGRMSAWARIRLAEAAERLVQLYEATNQPGK